MYIAITGSKNMYIFIVPSVYSQQSCTIISIFSFMAYVNYVIDAS